jgi:hypothetical protein
MGAAFPDAFSPSLTRYAVLKRLKNEATAANRLQAMRRALTPSQKAKQSRLNIAPAALTSYSKKKKPRRISFIARK